LKIIVTGGGTGGHIFPALAFIRLVKQMEEEAEFLYIGTEKGLESKIVPRADVPFRTIDISGLKRSLSPENVKTAIKLVRSIRESKRIIKDFRPDLVLGTGGYVCGPVVFAAARLGIPTVIHEQNSIPGLTNKILSRFVDKVAISFRETAQFFPREKVAWTGNPRATEVAGTDGKKWRMAQGLPRGKKLVLIFGGSRGARPINEAVIQMLPELGMRPYEVLYVTGEIHYQRVMEEARIAGEPENVKIVPFIHNMPEVLAAADLVVSRAGATSIAELTAIGVPAILIPSPYVTANHQLKNAELLAKNGAAIVLPESELNGIRLMNEMDRIIRDDARLIKMKESAKRIGVPNAGFLLYDLCVSLVKKRRG
jgi:UDP-N-acetylglucosamine--N-acetylmuramyl-(pentapeptide) pyrophosphoryl-undecaprenol N-acetylglucosamine transferase (EC 2.4.1.227)